MANFQWPAARYLPPTPFYFCLTLYAPHPVASLSWRPFLDAARPGPNGLETGTPAVAANYLKKSNTVLLDVRTPAEFAAGHLKGARNIDFRAAGFSFEIAKLDKDKTYLLYCASGNRSGQTTVLMEETGFKKVINIGAFEDLKAGGIKAE